jgi:Zn-dependent oligopeptidase
LWHKFFKNDPLNREVGQRHIDKVLQYGGSKDAKKIMIDMLDEPLTIDSFIEDIKEFVFQIQNQTRKDHLSNL